MSASVGKLELNFILIIASRWQVLCEEVTGTVSLMTLGESVALGEQQEQAWRGDLGGSGSSQARGGWLA